MGVAIRKAFDAAVIQAATTETATGNGSDVYLPGMVNALAFTLDVTAAATAGGDTLDVFIQTKIDTTNWIDVVHFSQVLGTGGAKTFVAKIIADAALTEFETGTALGAAGDRDLLGDVWRARWTVASASAPSFTFSVTACPM